MSKLFHYKSCGLDNIWLRNGFEVQKSSYGEAVAIADLEGLHKAIGLYVTENEPLLTNAEIRFLRKELDLSQIVLAQLLGVSESTVRNWEAGRQDIAASSDRMLRLIYREHIEGNAFIRTMIERLNGIENDEHITRLELESTASGWRAAA